MPHQNGRHQTANDPHPWCLLFLHFGIAHRLQSSGGACRMTRCHRGHKWGMATDRTDGPKPSFLRNSCRQYLFLLKEGNLCSKRSFFQRCLSIVKCTVLKSKGSDTFCFPCLPFWGEASLLPGPLKQFFIRMNTNPSLELPRVLPWIWWGFFNSEKEIAAAKNSATSCYSPNKTPFTRMRFLCKRTLYLNASNRKMAHHPRCVLQRNSMQIPTNGLTKNDPNRFCQETTGSKICFVFCSTGCSNFSGGKTISRPVWWEVINARARR